MPANNSGCLLSVARLPCKRPRKASPRATSLTFGSAARAWAAAPVLRPPQPINPTRSVSLRETLFWAEAWCAASVPATTARPEFLRNCRRVNGDVAEDGGAFMAPFLIDALQTGEWIFSECARGRGERHADDSRVAPAP